MWLAVCIGGLLLYFLWELLRSSGGDVSKPGRFFYTKKWMLRLLLLLNGYRKSDSGQKSSRKERGYGISIRDPLVLEVCQPLEDHTMAIDSTYFNGFAEDGTSLALRIARKHNREGEVWVMLDVPGIGYLQHPLHPDTGVYNMPDGAYRSGGCEFKVIEPMRSWRVVYNGLLRQGLHNDPQAEKTGRLVTVKLALRWECSGDPFNFDIDIDKSLLAEAVAKETWTRKFWQKLRGNHQTHYEQCGELMGTLEVEGYEARHLVLKSFRDHTFGVRNWEMFERYAIHFIWIEEVGVMAMVACLWMPGYITHLQAGYLMYSNGVTYPVTSVTLDLDTLTRDHTPPDRYSFTFCAAGEHYHVYSVATVTPEVYHYRSRGSRILERMCTYRVNGKTARGLAEFHYRNPSGPAIADREPVTLPLLREPVDLGVSKGQITLQFTDPVCQSSGVVGGKGAQLALLTQIQSQVGATVPKGFCLTLDAFELQLVEYPEIVESLEHIVESIRQEKLDVLQTLCSEAVELLASCKVCQPIETKLISQLQATFGDKYQHVRLAIRSSAAGEDGGESSSAGQMETFLGVVSHDNVLEAVRKCWSSAYTYQAVEYRRQHGQPVRTSVGVVVQEMVRSEVAGVIFTNDPRTGNSGRMVLDASFGLGEAVVSGKTTPDSFILQRYHDNSVEILERHLGNKTVEIAMAVILDDGGVTEKQRAPAKECCLHDNQVVTLATLAIKIEDYFGSPRDIEWAMAGENIYLLQVCEWAMAGENIYLLQARPVTTSDQETDDDIIHEFDSPVMTPHDRVTIGNIGEMMPGCVTPLTGSVFGRAVDYATSVVGADFGGGNVSRFASKSTICNSGRLFINLTHVAQNYQKSLLYQKEALELNLVGAVLADHTQDMIDSSCQHRASFLTKLYNVARFFIVNNRKVKVADGWQERLKTYQVGRDCERSADLYDAICRQLPDYYQVWETSVHKSSKSGSYGGVVMGIIAGGKNDWSTENCSDLALLLSQCHNVYSADVPLALKDIAKCIVEKQLSEEFMNKTDKDSVAWMGSPQCPALLSEKYRSFLCRHGHRCVREAEFVEKSWRAEPEKLIRVIKALIRSEAFTDSQSPVPSLDSCMAQLQSSVSWLGRFLLRHWLVQKARDAVGNRELGKSIAVEAADRFKQAYWRLADMLFLEGRLPERELMFYLTHREIGELIQTRSARLVTKAVRRRRLQPVQSELEFPRISVGRPVPIERKSLEQRQATFTLKGMPVSRGCVQGTARVIRSLTEADQIQKGDILIVSYTDVGWTPYFPLIAGLVTELGGLVSHGAVVAREYGLPCVVNVPNATIHLLTGDMVRLDGTKGTVDRLES
ncbi:putative phosphoenolpyruvate synthase isoform X2 [Dreissena polymorpha]|uniref:putative phosphoenolpyruvate synthase isoform X2 n=1 Tax=Dreissena polymorpha TaxID=45954 RepID=UPI002264EF92|nr:putative phosphoenolpyruvate synthase isoform X2 [Dreissena polymorpha]